LPIWQNPSPESAGFYEYDYNADDPRAATGGWKWWGIKRQTTKEIALLKDEGKMSYADIEKALQAIKNDKGQENYAKAKRVELVLDDMLTYGFKNIHGDKIPQRGIHSRKEQNSWSNTGGACANDSTKYSIARRYRRGIRWLCGSRSGDESAES
jgi:hypothetical protein